MRPEEDRSKRTNKPIGLEAHIADPRRSDEPVYRPPRFSSSGLLLPERLSFWLSPGSLFSPKAFATRLGAYRRTLFIPDSSFFDQNLDPGVWAALLSNPRRVVLLPHVREELGTWLQQQAEHPAAAAVLADELGEIDLESIPTNAALYYVNLLVVRKRLYEGAALELRGKLGRDPTDSELLQTKRDLGHILGPRAILLARKGAVADARSPTYATDEIIVVTAFLHAIRRGQSVVILTRDQDLVELFYKLQWLLDTHYRAWFLASEYLGNLAGIRSRLMPSGPPWSDAFTGNNNRLVFRSDRDIEAVRSHKATPIPVECWLIRDDETRVGFSVESGMQNLIHAKEVTGGLNHATLAPRNFHLWLAPLPIPQELRHFSALAEDLRVQVDGTNVAIPVLDFNQSVLTEERMRPHVNAFGLRIPDT